MDSLFLFLILEEMFSPFSHLYHFVICGLYYVEVQPSLDICMYLDNLMTSYHSVCLYDVLHLLMYLERSLQMKPT